MDISYGSKGGRLLLLVSCMVAMSPQDIHGQKHEEPKRPRPVFTVIPTGDGIHASVEGRCPKGYIITIGSYLYGNLPRHYDGSTLDLLAESKCLPE